MDPRLHYPDLGIGVGLRTTHFQHLLEASPPVAWLEILSENFMATRGRPRAILDRLAERYPVVMHGVSLSIGSTDPLDTAYLRELVQLRDEIGARWVSDHLCWTGVSGRNSHDLLPMPYTRATLAHVADRVRAVQDRLGAPLILENPSTYVTWTASTLPEAEFLAELTAATGCGLLLDVNNVYVNGLNFGFDPKAWLARVPLQRVRQMHIAGHARFDDLVIDTHGAPVIDPVIELMQWTLARIGHPIPVLLERDNHIPDLDDLLAERERIQAAYDRVFASEPSHA